jgi:hypothetical protein
MLGGPTANTPRYLGPYQVRTKSSTISITDIPAGRYDGMFLLYADRAVHDEEVTIEGDATTLGQIFSLPDTDFLAFVEGDDEYEVDVLLAGRASIGMVESPRVVEGVENSFPVTMIPVTPYWIPVEFSMFGYPMYLSGLLYTFDGTVYKSFKGFVGIPGIQMIVSSMYPDYTGNVRLTFSNESTSESMTVNSLSVYDGEGARTAAVSGPFPITMSVGQKHSLSVPVPVSEFDEIFFYLDVSGGTPAITITLDAETITGSLNLANYISNFDSVEGVMFCTEDPTGLFSDTLEEGNSQYLVGWGGLTANETNEYHDFTGTIYSEYAGRDLYLIVVGEKYGQMVLYASTYSFTVSEMSYLVPALTPLLQYVVVYSQSNGLGLADYDGMPAQLTIMQGNTTIAQSFSYVEYLTEGDLAEYYVATILLVDTSGETVVLPAGDEYEILFKVTDSEFTQELYNKSGYQYIESTTDAFIVCVFDLA